MQYFQPANGEIRMLEKKNVDTGMGLERTIATLQGAESVYDTDAFAHILARISELSGKNYRDNAENDPCVPHRCRPHPHQVRSCWATRAA